MNIKIERTELNCHGILSLKDQEQKSSSLKNKNLPCAVGFRDSRKFTVCGLLSCASFFTFSTPIFLVWF